jgi:thiol-disulfide isomerase/thioredoxin
MTDGALRTAGAALLVALGVWAGTRVYLARSALQSHQEVPLPAGGTGAPNSGDLAYTDAAPEGPGLDSVPRPKIPDRLPEFSLENSTGKATSITSFGGKSLIINFWATWCAPCRSEIPLLQTLHTEWAGRDVSVVGIAVDYRDPVLAFAERYKIGYPLLIGEQDALDAAAAFGVDSPVFPFTVFTDRRGEVVALFIGELHRAQAELILSEVQNLNKDLIELKAARRAIAEGLSALAQKAS